MSTHGTTHGDAPFCLEVDGVKCVPTFRQGWIPPEAKEMQAQLESVGLNAAVPDGHKIKETRLIRTSQSVVFAAFGERDWIRDGDFSAIAKFSNLAEDREREFGTPEQHYAKLVWVAGQIATQGEVPVAKVLATGSAEVDGKSRPWILEEKLTGAEAPAGLDRGMQQSLWKETGRVAGSIFKIEPQGYGTIFDPATGRFVQTWDEALDARVEKASLDRLVELGGLTEEQRADILGIVEDRLRTMDERYPRALNHGDLGPINNLFFSGIDSEQPVVTGVLDFDDAASLPGSAWTIAWSRWHQIAFERNLELDSYLEGMGIAKDEYEGQSLQKDADAALVLGLCWWKKMCMESVNRGGDWPAPNVAEKALARLDQHLPQLIDRLKA
ncbi:MAG: aminoglycoside phosphotransferase family protein [Bdellovibrionales bacterium]|nr:aminoglycoside phosphotransferase family protein [Bdellovibrionales bacterium]